METIKYETIVHTVTKTTPKRWKAFLALPRDGKVKKEPYTEISIGVGTSPTNSRANGFDHMPHWF
jgi:hypothetical protein